MIKYKFVKYIKKNRNIDYGCKYEDIRNHLSLDPENFSLLTHELDSRDKYIKVTSKDTTQINSTLDLTVLGEDYFLRTRFGLYQFWLPLLVSAFSLGVSVVALFIRAN